MKLAFLAPWRFALLLFSDIFNLFVALAARGAAANALSFATKTSGLPALTNGPAPKSADAAE